MKKRLVILVLAALAATLVALAGCATTPVSSTEADATAIRQIYTAYTTAAERGDSAAWLLLWDKGGIQLRPNAPARSKERLDAEVPAQFKARIDASDMTMVINPLEITVNGPWAYSQGLYTQNMTNKSTGAKTLVDGKYLTIFKRQADGSWKIYRDCFNSNTT
jgi:ketosteroid isomerase-like protein